MKRLAVGFGLTLAIGLLATPHSVSAKGHHHHFHHPHHVVILPATPLFSSPGVIRPHAVSPFVVGTPQPVWVAGFWAWDGFGWVWVPGHWVFPRQRFFLRNPCD